MVAVASAQQGRPLTAFPTEVSATSSTPIVSVSSGSQQPALAKSGVTDQGVVASQPTGVASNPTAGVASQPAGAFPGFQPVNYGPKVFGLGVNNRFALPPSHIQMTRALAIVDHIPGSLVVSFHSSSVP